MEVGVCAILIFCSRDLLFVNVGDRKKKNEKSELFALLVRGSRAAVV